MSSAVSLPNHAFTGQAKSSKRLTSIVHIHSPETDNCYFSLTSYLILQCVVQNGKLMSRECHNHKIQQISDTKRKREKTQTNTRKTIQFCFLRNYRWPWQHHAPLELLFLYYLCYIKGFFQQGPVHGAFQETKLAFRSNCESNTCLVSIFLHFQRIPISEHIFFFFFGLDESIDSWSWHTWIYYFATESVFNELQISGNQLIKPLTFSLSLSLSLSLSEGVEEF